MKIIAHHVIFALCVAELPYFAGPLALVSPAEGAEQSALTAIQREFSSMPREKRLEWMRDSERRKALRGSRKGKPLQIVLQWRDDPENPEAVVRRPRRTYNVEVRRQCDGLPVFFTTTGPVAKVSNPEIGCG